LAAGKIVPAAHHSRVLDFVASTQLKPGTYSVKAEAPGFEPKQNDNVVSGLGQKIYA